MSILICFLSSIFISSKDIFSKQLASSLSSTESTFGSFAFSMPFYFVVLLTLWYLGLEDFHYTSAFFGLVALRGISDSFAEWFRMEALSFGEISFLVPYLSLSVLFIAILAPFITGDTIGTLGILGVFLIFIGCVVLKFKMKETNDISSSVTNDSNNKIAIIFAILSSFFQALNTCIDKLAAHSASPTFSAFAVTLFAAFIFLPAVLRSKTALPTIKSSYKISLFRGFAETGTMITKYSALLYLPTQAVAGLLRSSIIITIIGGATFLKEGDFKKRLFAGVLVFAGILCIIFDL